VELKQKKLYFYEESMFNLLKKNVTRGIYMIEEKGRINGQIKKYGKQKKYTVKNIEGR
jgi:hypothetical protein